MSLFADRAASVSVAAPRDRGAALWFGADYNPDQWPEDVWSRDVELMAEAGVNLVSLGIFSWARLEPVPGRFDFGWLDRVIGLLAGAGVGVGLATPTASPPPWMTANWPDSLSVDERGVRMSHGSRNHFCPTSPSYRERCRLLVAAMSERYRAEPAIELWHIGNEYGQVCCCNHCAAAFRVWLRERYGDLDSLADAWGAAFWSQGYSSWDEVLPPRAAPYLHNPGQLLDFRRFTSDAQLACYLEQKSIIRAADPATPITTNWMGAFVGLDYRSWAPHLDVVADDSYPDPADPDSPVGSAFTADLMRSLAAGKPWMLMEQAPGAVNWRPVNVVKDPARIRLDSFQAIARGAVGSCYFQWRASRAGAERFHGALVPHTGERSRVFTALREHGRELANSGLTALRPAAARVALVFDWDNWWATLAPDLPSSRLDALQLTQSWYGVLWRRGIAVDLVASTDDLTAYAVICCPWQFCLTTAAAQRLTAAVARGAHLVLGAFSGIVDETSRVHPGPFPAGLTEVVGASVADWLPIADGEQVGVGAGAGARWTEVLTPAEAVVVASFAGGPADGDPAVVRHRYGAGAATYLATILEPEALDRLLGGVLDSAGVRGPLDEVPSGVEAVATDAGLALLNRAGGETEVVLPEPMTDLLDGSGLAGTVRLAAGEVRLLVRAGTQIENDKARG